MTLQNPPNLTCNFPFLELIISISLASFVHLSSLLLVFPTLTPPLSLSTSLQTFRSPQAKTTLPGSPALGH